jgi:putative membrane protein
MTCILIAQEMGQGKDTSAQNKMYAPDKMKSPEVKSSSDAAAFIKEASQGGLYEVDLGKLASTHATNDGVKEFARMMQQDHGKSNADLKQLAIKKKFVISMALDAEHKDSYDRLAKLSGDEFNREYINVMVSDHEKDLRDFQRVAETSTDPDVKTFANNMLPTLKKHLQEAKRVSGTIEPKKTM